jgi:hypothetical protein
VEPALIVPLDDVLKLLGPTLTLLVLAYGFLQLYPRLFESMGSERTFGREVRRRSLGRALLALRIVITFLVFSVIGMVAYIGSDVSQKRWGWPTWTDEVLIVIILSTFLIAIMAIGFGAWWIKVESLAPD